MFMVILKDIAKVYLYQRYYPFEMIES